MKLDADNEKRPPSAPTRLLVVGLGESLFDCFPDGERLGGAPLNGAVHAHALLSRLVGGAMVATRVGRDRRGDEVRSMLASRGIDTACVQSDPDRPTGTVRVTLDGDGHASYVFTSDVAWDALAMEGAWRSLAESCNAVCFGTLAQRSEPSRRAIGQFLSACSGALRVFDVNLRQDFYSETVLRDSLVACTACKMNEEELGVVCELLGIAGDAADDDERAENVRSAFELAWLAVTRGERGVALYRPDGKHEGTPVPLNPLPGADTVGAGDACCAGLIVGSLLGWPAARVVALANRLGSEVASRPGATPELPEEVLALVDG
ncbi:2-dehydro-3-deoxygluconokinase [Pirellulimonas nuda]|uniref:2-dehydro-3-deoxygluconokinase n=1 Tax=Pirellulimonas nuda TaxID=2528009 RepID=A0A518D889_9BACT|nr:carbohydrate kinase [Pirellulimonas nuda]QDU87696.1 2-dehydro-3-deoxygluconokinase [Pirellulimonas nuda]